MVDTDMPTLVKPLQGVSAYGQIQTTPRRPCPGARLGDRCVADMSMPGKTLLRAKFEHVRSF